MHPCARDVLLPILTSELEREWTTTLSCTLQPLQITIEDPGSSAPHHSIWPNKYIVFNSYISDYQCSLKYPRFIAYFREFSMGIWMMHSVRLLFRPKVCTESPSRIIVLCSQAQIAFITIYDKIFKFIYFTPRNLTLSQRTAFPQIKGNPEIRQPHQQTFRKIFPDMTAVCLLLGIQYRLESLTDI